MALYSRESRVFWADSDAARIAHFSSIFRYCEATEEEFMIRLTGGWKPGKVIFPRVHASCNFKSPLRVHERFRVDIESIIIGKSSITYEFHIYNLDQDALASICKLVTVALDPETFKPVPVPRELEKLLLSKGAIKKA